MKRRCRSGVQPSRRARTGTGSNGGKVGGRGVHRESMTDPACCRKEDLFPLGSAASAPPFQGRAFQTRLGAPKPISALSGSLGSCRSFARQRQEACSPGRRYGSEVRRAPMRRSRLAHIGSQGCRSAGLRASIDVPPGAKSLRSRVRARPCGRCGGPVAQCRAQGAGHQAAASAAGPASLRMCPR